MRVHRRERPQHVFSPAHLLRVRAFVCSSAAHVLRCGRLSLHQLLRVLPVRASLHQVPTFHRCGHLSLHQLLMFRRCGHLSLHRLLHVLTVWASVSIAHVLPVRGFVTSSAARFFCKYALNISSPTLSPRSQPNLKTTRSHSNLLPPTRATRPANSNLVTSHTTPAPHGTTTAAPVGGRWREHLSSLRDSRRGIRRHGGFEA